VKKLFGTLNTTKAVGMGAVLLTVLGWISQMPVETETGRIVKLLVLGAVAGGLLGLIYAAQVSPGKDR